MSLTQNELKKTKSQYNAIKFKYLFLKFINEQTTQLQQQEQEQEQKQKQEGGYTESSPTHLAAAAIAVINCTYAGTNQKSIDCVQPLPNNDIKIKEINDELIKLENISGIKSINRKRELNIELNNLKNIKSNVNTIDINNRICDQELATIASIFLSIIYITEPEKFITLINDLINTKFNNCKFTLVSNTKEIEAKKMEIVKYYLNVLKKINSYLENIGKQKQDGVSYEAIFTNAEYAKQDKKMIEKLREKGIKISKDDEENFRMVNQFIGPNIDNIKLINLEKIYKSIMIKNNLLSDNILNILKNEYTTPTTIISTNNFIVFGVYTINPQTKKVIINNPITWEEAKKRNI
jgi:hypothetical protein